MKKRGFQKLAPMAAKRSLTGAKTQGRPMPAPAMPPQMRTITPAPVAPNPLAGPMIRPFGK